MTMDETIGLLGIMKIAYPNFYKNLSGEEAKQASILWFQMFENDNSKVVTEAVKALICTLKYPPTIADVKEKMRIITKQQDLTEMEAWNRVKVAIKYYTAGEEFEKLPSLLKRLVGSAGQLREWSQMDAEHVETVVKSNFMRSYTARVKADEQLEILPESTKELISSIGNKFKMVEDKAVS